MGDRSKIEWCNATWNPTTGCTKVSAGCKFCYAERFHQRISKVPFETVEVHPERLMMPLRWTRPRKIFVNSMSDLFHEQIPESFLREVFAVMRKAYKHTFQILTKRPQRMLEYCRIMFQNPADNVWLGVSVEDQKTADERIPLLLQTPAAVRFVSYEPALAAINLKLWLRSSQLPWRSLDMPEKHFLDWVIAGGESGPHARPSHPDWFRSICGQCQAARVPFFFKQWGEWAPIQYHEGEKCYLKVSVPIPEIATPSSKEIVWENVNMVRQGRRRAGRLLDGREWNEFPEIK